MLSLLIVGIITFPTLVTCYYKLLQIFRIYNNKTNDITEILAFQIVITGYYKLLQVFRIFAIEIACKNAEYLQSQRSDK
jgi:hypothetical protein